jgi:hypothetical protein
MNKCARKPKFIQYKKQDDQAVCYSYGQTKNIDGGKYLVGRAIAEGDPEIIFEYTEKNFQNESIRRMRLGIQLNAVC